MTQVILLRIIRNSAEMLITLMFNITKHNENTIIFNRPTIFCVYTFRLKVLANLINFDFVYNTNSI